MKKLPLFLLLTCVTLIYGLPSLRNSIRQPLHVSEGEDALITCVVSHLDNNTLLWKREDPDRHTTRILTAGENRVTSDSRFHVLHDSAPPAPGSVTLGGDVWVLVIKKARSSDSGVYICEVNSNPILRSFHALEVTSSNLQPPGAVTASPAGSAASTVASIEISHNYTDCCKTNGVSSSCLPFCSLKNILDGTTGQDPEKCEPEFPSIVKCMADGRNHVPCCIDEGIPDICQDICRGEYTIPTDDIRSHVSCSSYTEQTLACISEGIEILPGPPEMVAVEPLTETSLKISWSRPLQNTQSITHYYVNISTLPSFDSLDHKKTSIDRGDENVSKKGTVYTQVKIEGAQNSTIIENLQPFTMYEITVISHNVHGSSLPSVRVRSLTRTPEVNLTPGLPSPQLPDIKGCCNSKGIYHSRCVDKFCDPVRTSDISLPDLMICAPWAKDSFSCLANGIDHTGCCRSRGLPDACVQLCTGNVTRVDYNQFRCVQYMDDLSNCLLQGYGVLAGPPIALRATNVNPTFAIIQWEAPKTLAKTVVSYNIRYRSTEDEENEGYKTINTKQIPYILEQLKSQTEYEVYVSAVNEHGVGEPSSRILFTTPPGEMYDESASDSSYNVTACCETLGLSSHCMPLCDYSAKLSDLRSLTTVCGKEFPKLLRCGAGGRNHIDCCERRGIPKACLGFCTGSVTEELVTTAAACLPYVGNVIQCFEEGTDLLPAPIIQLHATSVSDDSVTLVWQPPDEGSVTFYIIHYEEVEKSSSEQTTFELDKQINVTEPVAIISGLKTNSLYNFFVLSANEHGTSLPSSILTINISKEALVNGTIAGVPSAPMGISVASRSADYLTISWQQPMLLHPTDRLRYKLHYRMKNETSFTVMETSVPSYRLDNLTANSQHILYVTAVNDNGESRPSETLLAWTDPAFAPIVELPTIHPLNIVLEGGSMTVLCVAMGTPMPTISLYVAGNLIRQERTRHMVTVLSNVTRVMNTVTCYAENGHGQPSQSSKRILIGRRPNIVAPLITMASLGDDVTLECEIDAHPKPQWSFSRDADGVNPITNSSKYEVKAIRETQEVDGNYIAQLKIRNMDSSDSGVYYCSAQNNFGSFFHAIKLQARQKPQAPVMNVAQCCSEQNVTSICMDACTLFLDIDSVIDRPECINDFHKLMKCAADGSDHRGCCTQWGVPRRCLDWCRGEAVTSVELCALSYTKPIVSCFHEGRDRIPGPPKNIRIQVELDNAAKISWDPPTKNPETVELYRVFWRPQGSKLAEKNDTRLTSLDISGLKEGVTYELVIKAGNHYGTSTLTEPLLFTVDDKYVVSSSTRGNPHIGVAVGVVVALIFIGCAIAAAVCFLRKKKIIGIKLSGGVSFDNPAFLRRNNQNATDTLQIIPNESAPDGTDATAQGIQANSGWKQETLHAAGPTEVPPTLYEELRLGADGVGFKRFK